MVKVIDESRNIVEVRFQPLCGEMFQINLLYVGLEACQSGFVKGLL